MGLGLTKYNNNNLNDTQKYLTAKMVLQSRGDGYQSKEAIQSVLELAVSSVIVPDYTTTSTVSTSYDSKLGKDLLFNAEIVYPDFENINDDIVVDHFIELSDTYGANFTIRGYMDGVDIGNINVTTNTLSFWTSEFPKFSQCTALKMKSGTTERLTFNIENIPAELYRKNITMTIKTICSADGYFDSSDKWVKELSLFSKTVDIITPESPYIVYFGKYDSTASGFGVNKFNSLKLAVEKVAANGTVKIESGTFAFINSMSDQVKRSEKNVSIEGSGLDKTILEICTYPGAFGAIYADKVSSFKISNLTIRGSQNCSNISYAIYASGGCTTLYNVKIQDIKGGTTSGCGIKVVSNIITGAGNLIVDKCYFEAINQHAIHAQNSKAQIGVNSKNYFAGSSSNAKIQSAVCVENGLDVKIQNNTISDHVGTKYAGIYFCSGSAEISNNSITGCNNYTGICVNIGSSISNTIVNSSSALSIIEKLKAENNAASVGVYESNTSTDIGDKKYP